MNKKILVVGAGFSGATIANLFATKLNYDVHIIDKKGHIAGISYDYTDNNGIVIHKYGSHIFHTSNEKVWNFISQFCDFNQYIHKVLAFIDGKYCSLPFNLNSIYQVFNKQKAQIIEEKLYKKYEYNKKISVLDFLNQDDEDLKQLARYVYEKIFLPYSLKQWGFKPDELNCDVCARVPIFISKDDRYFQDKYQGIPKDGYTNLISKMLNYPNIKVSLNCDFKTVRNSLKDYDMIFYTGAIDEYFGYKFGQLPYRSVRLELEEYNQEFYQFNSVINYPCAQKFTRIHEYKYFTNIKINKTVIAREYPEAFVLGKNNRCYPILKKDNFILYEKYLNEAKAKKNLCFLGRLGDYKYYDMDKAILRAIEVFDSLDI